jgi:hypothetical protein
MHQRLAAVLGCVVVVGTVCYMLLLGGVSRGPSDCWQAGHFNCDLLDTFAASPPFAFSPFKRHALFKVTAANGINVVFKGACDPEKSHRIRQPWMEEYAFGLAVVLGIGNVPCAQSKRFFLDEMQGGMAHSAIPPECIHSRHRRFVVGSITALIPDFTERTVSGRNNNCICPTVRTLYNTSRA